MSSQMVKNGKGWSDDRQLRWGAPQMKQRTIDRVRRFSKGAVPNNA
jgi:hypothetical protein